MRLFLPVLALCVSFSVSAARYKPPPESALDDFVKFDPTQVEQWKELQAVLPPFPRDADLIPVRMPVTYTLKAYIDGKSISVGKDDVTRYTLVLESASGVRNVFYEGLRCLTREYKTYAVGTPDGAFELLKQQKWERIPYYEVNAFRFQLLRNYACDPNSLSAALTARDFIRRLQNATNE